jgi:hypothetical protein
MGVCESSKSNDQQNKKNISTSSFGDYSTGANSKENDKKSIVQKVSIFYQYIYLKEMISINIIILPKKF